ncbi:MAG: hypothetical protein JXR96_13055 [Deltaproteobacteria bacterium]|nr:hypothetical protein [Deltaproteobacteria bacterium]
MRMRHLDERLFADLLHGRLGERAERALLDHLQADCETCERFLAGLDEETEGRLWALLERAQRVPEQAAPDRAAVLDALESEAPTRARRLLAALPALVACAAAASLLLVAALFWPVPADGPSQRVKGEAGLAEIELGFGLVDRGPDGQLQVVPGSPGRRVPGSARLVFQLRTGGVCRLFLARLGEKAELLVPAGAQAAPVLPAGSRVLEIDGRPASFSLAGQRGRLRFAAGCAAPDVSPERALELLAGPAGEGLEELERSGFEIEIAEERP